MEQKILILGYGEIGKSVHGLYQEKPEYTVFYRDLEEDSEGLEGAGPVDVLHVCIPFSELDFEASVVETMTEFEPKLVIINSTVPVGTTRSLCESTEPVIVHSPVMGVHPNLTKSMQTFTKIIGSCTKESLKLATDHFEGLGIKTLAYDKPEDSEAAKLWSTSYYNWNILFTKFIHKFCEEHNLNFDDVYITTNEIYNDGYEKMGMRFVNRPILKFVLGSIGGHCLTNNLNLLKDFSDSRFAHIS